MTVTIYSSVSGGRFPSTDTAGQQHILGDVVLGIRHYVIKGSRFESPTPDYTGYGSNGLYYASGVYSAAFTPPTAHWASEPAGSNRGTLDRFPDEIVIVGTNKELVILNARTYDVWMRFVNQPGAAGNGTLLGKVTEFSRFDFDTDSGVLYIATSEGLRIADFRRDRMAVLHGVSGTSIVTAAPTHAVATNAASLGSIYHRNVSNQMDVGNAWASAMNVGWDLFLDGSEVLDVAVSRKTSPISSAAGAESVARIAVGLHRGLKVFSSGLYRSDLPSGDLGANAPANAYVHHGAGAAAAPHVPAGALFNGNNSADTVVQPAPSAATGTTVNLDADLIAAGPIQFSPTFRFDVGSGFSRIVKVGAITQTAGGCQLTLDTGIPEGTAGTTDYWEALANAWALHPHVDGTLGIMAGNRLIHATTEQWTAPTAPSVILGMGFAAKTDLPAAVTQVHDLKRIGSTYYISTNLGVFRSTLVSGVPGAAELLYTNNSITSPQPLYENPNAILQGDPAEVRDFSVDPVSGNFGLVHGALPSISSSAVTPAAENITFAGQTISVNVGLGANTVTFPSATLTPDAIIVLLRESIPGSRCSYLGAGMFKIASLVGAVTLSASANNALLNLPTAGTTSALTPSVFSEIDSSIQIRLRRVLVSGGVTTLHTMTDSIYQQTTLVPPPSPGTLHITESGGQVITDDGEGKLLGSVDSAVTTTLDYASGDIVFQLASVPSGNVEIRYLPATGVAHAVVGARISV
tara:strand:- start:367 stop:2607 length:2241 start_codon:yes stop_codon:yes gene_type:complete